MIWISFMLFLIFMVIFIANVTSMLCEQGAWSRAYENLARRYGGWFRPAKLTQKPSVRFNYKKNEVRVRCRRSTRNNKGKVTEFRITTPYRNWRLSIVPVGFLPRNRGLQRSSQSPTGDAGFDEKFAVFATGKQMQQALSLLTPTLRWHLVQLMECDSEVVEVAFERSCLVVFLQGYIKDSQKLDDFVRYSLGLFDQIELSESKGIEFNESGMAVALGQVKCPICGSEIEHKMVLCVRCKTPHCSDCWEYNGKCAMYACDETRHRSVKEVFPT